MSKKTTTHAGVLLINLGSPDAPRPREVRRYLREFLSDPRVIDIPAVARWLLLNLIILPFRPRESAAAYRSIWTDRGSPLIYHTEDLTAKVAARLAKQHGDGVVVKFAMRYGNPSIASALAEFRDAGVRDIHVLPLYPQYSTAATASSIAKVFAEAGEHWNPAAIRILPPFFDAPEWLDPYAAVAAASLKDAAARSKIDRFDHILFSFHGIPERHILKGNVDQHCEFGKCCDVIGPKNLFCYRAHCFATARELAARLKLKDGEWGVSFQSRLGRTPWLRPYTDFEFAELPGRGVKHLAVLSPAFVADCLETLEELDMRGRESFREAGGESFHYVPCVNSDDAWADGVVKLLGL